MADAGRLDWRLRSRIRLSIVIRSLYNTDTYIELRGERYYHCTTMMRVSGAGQSEVRGDESDVPRAGAVSIHLRA